MSSLVDNPATSLLENPVVRQAVLPLSIEQYHRLGHAGIIPERTELLRGLLVEKMTKSPLHTWLVQLLWDRLGGHVPPGCHLRKEEPLTLSDSEPEPDLAVVSGSPADYRLEHPRAARFVVEVAVATTDLDRAKSGIYAAAGVDEYWIIHGSLKEVEVFRQATSAGYQRRQSYTLADDSVVSSSVPGFSVNPAELFSNP